MKKIKTVLLCAPFFGLFAVALPGCPSESSGQEPEAPPAEVICDKTAECGELDERVTAEQCAAKLGPVLATLQQDDGCGAVIEGMVSLSTCAAQHATCEELAGGEDGEGDEGDSLPGEDDSLPKDHPCYDENESYKKAIEEAEKQSPDSSIGCLLAAMLTVQSAMNPPPGTECTTSDECPEIQCPDGAGSGSGCENGWCMTEKELCE